MADPAGAATSCPNGVVTAPPGGGSVVVEGDLDAGQLTCTVSVQVTAAQPGTYENGLGSMTVVGVDLPATSTAVTFRPVDPPPVVDPPPSGTKVPVVEPPIPAPINPSVAPVVPAGGAPPAEPAPSRRGLRLTVSADRRTVRAGRTLLYTLRVSNGAGRTLHYVRTCDRLPAGLVRVRATGHAVLSRGRSCWTVRRLAAGATRVYRVRVRVLRGARGTAVTRATATAGSVASARATRTVRVAAVRTNPGGVTG